jgi:hypothetical protein
MANFRLTAAHELSLAPGRRQRFKAGTIISDGVSPQAGAVIWSGLNAAAVSKDMEPLDAGATTMKNASQHAGVGVRTTWYSGADSVDP